MDSVGWLVLDGVLLDSLTKPNGGEEGRTQPPLQVKKEALFSVTELGWWYVITLKSDHWNDEHCQGVRGSCLCLFVWRRQKIVKKELIHCSYEVGWRRHGGFATQCSQGELRNSVCRYVLWRTLVTVQSVIHMWLWWFMKKVLRSVWCFKYLRQGSFGSVRRSV